MYQARTGTGTIAPAQVQRHSRVVWEARACRPVTLQLLLKKMGEQGKARRSHGEVRKMQHGAAAKKALVGAAGMSAAAPKKLAAAQPAWSDLDLELLQNRMAGGLHNLWEAHPPQPFKGWALEAQSEKNDTPSVPSPSADAHLSTARHEPWALCSTCCW